jgi:hypothetical protein
VAIAALLFAVWVATTTLFDPQDARNPLPGVFYVLLWVGLVALSLAVGPGIPWRNQDLAARLPGGDVGRRVVLR